MSILIWLPRKKKSKGDVIFKISPFSWNDHHQCWLHEVPPLSLTVLQLAAFIFRVCFSDLQRFPLAVVGKIFNTERPACIWKWQSAHRNRAFFLAAPLSFKHTYMLSSSECFSMYAQFSYYHILALNINELH